MHIPLAQRPVQFAAMPRFGNDSQDWQHKLTLDLRLAYKTYQKNFDDILVPVQITVKDSDTVLAKLQDERLFFDIVTLDPPPVLGGLLRMSQLEKVARLDEVTTIEKAPELLPFGRGRLFFGDTFQRR